MKEHFVASYKKWTVFPVVVYSKLLLRKLWSNSKETQNAEYTPVGIFRLPQGVRGSSVCLNFYSLSCTHYNTWETPLKKKDGGYLRLPVKTMIKKRDADADVAVTTAKVTLSDQRSASTFLLRYLTWTWNNMEARSLSLTHTHTECRKGGREDTVG